MTSPHERRGSRARQLSRWALLTLCVPVMLACAGSGTRLATASPAAPRFRESARNVITWVAPYAVATSKARLQESFDGIGMKDGLTHLALQFWEPTTDGAGLQRVQRGDDTSDEAIRDLRDWGHANGVRVMLCVYNYNVSTESWDWPRARRAFGDHGDGGIARSGGLRVRVAERRRTVSNTLDDPLDAIVRESHAEDVAGEVASGVIPAPDLLHGHF